MKDKSFFSLLIIDLLLKAISISSTYNIDRCALLSIAYCTTDMGNNGFECNSCLLLNCQNACTTAFMIALIHNTISLTCISYSPFLQFWIPSAETCRSPLQDRHKERRSSCRADQVSTHTVPPMQQNLNRRVLHNGWEYLIVVNAFLLCIAFCY